MITRRAVFLFTLSILLAGLAAWIANGWFQRQAHASDGEVTVVAAALEIPFGAKIERSHIKLLGLPAPAVPRNAIRDLAQAEGKVAKQTFYAGEILVSERIGDTTGGSNLSAIVAPNMRAVTVRVNDVVGVGGFVLPGNRVDVVSARKFGNSRALTETVLWDIKVLAVDQSASTDKNEPVIVRAVTLEVTPRQAETLVKATQEGVIQLALRNPVDRTKVAAVRTTPKPAPPPEETASVTVIRGTKVDTTKVDANKVDVSKDSL